MSPRFPSHLRVAITLFLLCFGYMPTIAQDPVWTHLSNNDPFGSNSITDITLFENKLFAASGRGVFSSADYGATWEMLHKPNNLSAVTCIELSDSFFLAGTRTALYRSSDKGKTWNRVLQDSLGFADITKDGNKLYAVSYLGSLYTSIDNGNTWQRIVTISPQNVTYGIVVFQSVLYTRGPHSVFRSIDEGKTWTPVFVRNSPYGLSCLKATESALFVGAPALLYRSTNGTDWEEITSSPHPIIQARDILQLSPSLLITASTKSHFFQSTDGGKTWQASTIRHPFPDVSYSSVETLFYQAGTLIAQTYQGISVSTDQGTTWKDTYIPLYRASGLVMAAVNNTILTSTLSGLLRSGNSGELWEHPTSALRGIAASIVLPWNNNLLAVARLKGQRLFLSENEGRTWNNISSTLGDSTIAAIATLDNTIFALTASGLPQWTPTLFRSDNQGANWERIGNGLPDSLSITALASTKKQILITTNLGLYRSSDLGTTWIHTPSVFDTLKTYSSPSIAYSNDKLYILVRNTLYRSADDGITWTAYTIDSSDKNSNFVMAVAGNTIAVSGYHSYRYLFISTDQGVTWKRRELEADIAPVGVISLLLTPHYIFIGTNDFGLYRASLSDIITNVKDNNNSSLPPVSTFPNPTSSVVALHYSLEKQSSVNISLFDALGKTVLTTAIEPSSTGLQTTTLNVEHLPDGVYYWRITANTSWQGGTIVVRK